MAADDRLVDWCRERGYHVEAARQLDGTTDHGTAVIEFPCRFPAGTKLADSTGVLEQLETARRIATEWADNAVSCTAYYEPDDIPHIQSWMTDNWSGMKSMSFLLRSDHGFDQAPLEAIDRQEYDRRVDAIDTHNSSLIQFDTSSEHVDHDAGCVGGACPVR